MDNEVVLAIGALFWFSLLFLRYLIIHILTYIKEDLNPPKTSITKIKRKDIEKLGKLYSLEAILGLTPWALLPIASSLLGLTLPSIQNFFKNFIQPSDLIIACTIVASIQLAIFFNFTLLAKRKMGLVKVYASLKSKFGL